MTSTIAKVPLGELGKIVSGSTPDTGIKEYWENGTIPWITPADLTNHEGVFFEGGLRKITKKGYQSCSATILPPNSILYSSRAPIGHCAVTKYPLCTNQGFKSIVPNERLNSIFGFFALKFFTPEIEALGRGATFNEVNKEIFENFQIPLPPLAEQQRIAAILQKADRIRRLRRHARQLSDSFLQSIFFQMFGDVTKGTSTIPLVPLEELCTKITDGTHVTPKYQQSGVPFISIKDLTSIPGRIDFSNVKYISAEEHQKISKPCNVERDDILYTKVGSYGISQIVDTDIEFSIFVSVALLKPKKQLIMPKYLEIVLRTPWVKSQADHLVSGIGVPDLHLREIKTILIPLPNIEQQKIFTHYISLFETINRKQLESSRQAEHLFQSLLQSAFRGEL